MTEIIFTFQFLFLFVCVATKLELLPSNGRFCSTFSAPCARADISVMVEFRDVRDIVAQNDSSVSFELRTEAVIASRFAEEFGETTVRRTLAMPFAGGFATNTLTRQARHSIQVNDRVLDKFSVCVSPLGLDVAEIGAHFAIRSAHIEESNASERTTPVFRPALGTLIHEPDFFMNQSEPEVVLDVVFRNVTPVFSVIFNVYWGEDIVCDHLEQLMRLTRDKFELIVLFDFCGDESIERTMALVAKWRHYLPNKDLVRILLLSSAVPMYETTSNNYGMRASRGRYLAIVQDDQRMQVVGWNILLTLPLRRWPDRVFSVSGRCAHDRTLGGNLIGRCDSDVTRPLEMSAEARCSFYARGSGNRGPLLLDAKKAFALGLFDEQNFFMGDDDHDLNARAFHWFGWNSGFMPMDWQQIKHRHNVVHQPIEIESANYRRARVRASYRGQVAASSPAFAETWTFSDVCECGALNSTWWLQCSKKFE